MYELMVDSQFSSAHYLKGYEGDCARIHGHTWKVTLTVGAESVNEIGLGLDFKYISSVLDRITAQFDHRNLNDLDPFRDCNPSAENVAKVIYELCERGFAGAEVTVRSVTVHESDRYRVTYKPS